MKIGVKYKQNKNSIRLDFVKIGGFSFKLLERVHGFILKVHFVSEVINLKNVWNTTDNSRFKNGHLKQKVSQPPAATSGFKSLVP